MAGLLLAGCSSFVSAEEDVPPGVAPDTDTTTGAPQGSTTGAESTGSAQGSGGGSGDGAKVDVGDAVDASTSTTGGSTGEDVVGSTGSTSGGVATFPFEADYTGSFTTTACEVRGSGTLAIAVDALGIISGTATAFGSSANVTGMVDELGVVTGNVPLPVIGACELTGSINDGDLLGDGVFDCPGAPSPCSGVWNVVGVL